MGRDVFKWEFPVELSIATMRSHLWGQSAFCSFMKTQCRINMKLLHWFSDVLYTNRYIHWERTWRERESPKQTVQDIPVWLEWLSPVSRNIPILTGRFMTSPQRTMTQRAMASLQKRSVCASVCGRRLHGHELYKGCGGHFERTTKATRTQGLSSNSSHFTQIGAFCWNHNPEDCPALWIFTTHGKTKCHVKFGMHLLTVSFKRTYTTKAPWDLGTCSKETPCSQPSRHTGPASIHHILEPPHLVSTSQDTLEFFGH